LKNNMFMALTTTAINGAAAIITPLTGKPELAQLLLAICSLASPFLSIVLLKVYIKADDPPELVRQIAALESSIKLCKQDLKDENASPEFRQRTRLQLEHFQSRLQNARADFEAGRAHVVTPFSTD